MIAILVIVVVGLVLHHFQERRIDAFLERRYLLVVGTIALALAAVVGRIGFRMALSGDEIEHIHSGWYVDQGLVPFTDFFQHHHSLFWYAMIPVFKIFGHTVAAIKALRLAMVAQALATAWVTYRIAILSTRSREVGTIAAIALLSMLLFVEKGMEIRPDLPQTLVGLISIQCLLLFLRDGRRRDLAGSALAAAVSFLFLQKTVLLLGAYGILFAWLLYKRRLGWKDLLLFGAVFALPLLGGLAWLVHTGSVRDYILTNWRMNLSFARSNPAWLSMVPTLRENACVWLLGLGSAVFILLRKDTPGALKIVAFLGLVIYGSLYCLKRVHGQYFLPALPLLCVTAAAGMAWLFERLRLRSFYRVLLVLLVIGQPAHHLRFAKERFGTNRNQLKKIQFVLNNTSPTDYVYDGMPGFNVFRRDIHYFWFSIRENRGLDTYNQLTGNRVGKLDLPALIREKKPRIISDHSYDFGQSGLGAEYRKTKFNHVYIRTAAES